MDARTSQRPDAAGAPIERYATRLGEKSPKRNGPAAWDEVVSRFTSPENAVSVKKLVAMLAALSNARPRIEGVSPPGRSGSADASVTATPGFSCFRMLRLTCRRRHAVSVWLS